MKSIASVGLNFPGEDIKYIRIDSITSVSENDILIFTPDFSETHYSTNDRGHREYQGLRLYNKESSVKMKKHADHWRNELDHFVKNGGVLIINLSSKHDFYIHTGETRTSGTGKNILSSDVVTMMSNYDFFPNYSLSFNPVSGSKVSVNDSRFKNLFDVIESIVKFEVYIYNNNNNNNNNNIENIFTTIKKDRCVGTMIEKEKGLMMLMPHFNFSVGNNIKYNTRNDTYSWTSKGDQVGKSFVSNLIALLNAIKKNKEETPVPQWLNNKEYTLESSENTNIEIDKRLEAIKKYENEIVELKQLVIKQDTIKGLLYETGKNLELAVIEALHILGFKAENYDDGVLELDQVIISPEGHRYIGECEGKDTKDIDVTKFRQLMDSLSADFEKEDIHEKAYGLIFGNPQRLISPENRTLDFTKKCQIGAEREKIGLIKTEDLFRVCKYISSSNDIEFANRCRNTIFDQLGKIIVLPEP